MGFWIFMLIMVLLLPGVMAGVGLAFMKSAPKTINPVFGYRTARSMKTMETWTFAHHFIGRLWFAFGLFLIPACGIPMVLVVNQDVDRIGLLGAALCLLGVLVMLLTIIPTEIALSKTFDENGICRIEPATKEDTPSDEQE